MRPRGLLRLLTMLLTAAGSVDATSKEQLKAQALLPPAGLPLRTHVYADHACARVQNHLYYVPAGFCIGPLYFPASSIRISNAVPANCTLTAFEDGHCRQGTELPAHIGGHWPLETGSIRGRKVTKRWGHTPKGIIGPTDWNRCFGIGSDDEVEAEEGANSILLQC